jgi:hypothetical protein
LRGTVTALLVVLASACSVDGSFLDADLFLCEGPSDCSDDWSCVRATPYASDFCAPDCGDECDGVCVRQGDNESCLKGCRILDDNSTSECQSADYDCIRVSAQNDDGICYPVDGCIESADCDEGEDCLTALAEAFGIGGGGLRVDNLYCVPAPEDPTQCPPRSIHTDSVFSGDPGFDMCLPVCDASDTRCPPAFGCLRQLAGTGGLAACIPGIYGVPCDDDTNCMLGQCIDTGSGGRFCTTTCGEAERIGFGCENISLPLNGLGLRYRLECDPEAGGGNDGGLCVPRYEIGLPCTEPESDTFRCAAGLECIAFASGSRFCTKECATDDECNQTGRSRDNFCSTILDYCSPKYGAGERCLEGTNCLSGMCDAGRCA